MTVNVLGPRTMPCGHHRVIPTTELGQHHRRCDICRTTHTFTITRAEAASERTRTDVYRINWNTEQP